MILHHVGKLAQNLNLHRTALLWSDYKVVLCSLSDDVHNRSRLLRVRACLQLHLWAGWDGSTDVQKQAHWHATNSCGKETKADEALSLFEVQHSFCNQALGCTTHKYMQLDSSAS